MGHKKLLEQMGKSGVYFSKYYRLEHRYSNDAWKAWIIPWRSKIIGVCSEESKDKITEKLFLEIKDKLWNKMNGS